MGENMKCFFRYLPAVAIFALAAALAAALYATASHHTTYSTALKVYSVGWFAACVLSFYCGLIVVPRSLGVIFSFAGIVAFAIVCALDTYTLSIYPRASRAIQALPALFFIAAWATITIAAARNENKKIRLSSWLWMTIFVVLLACWGTFHFAQRELFSQRNIYLAKATEKTLALAANLEAYKQTNGAYPATLEEAEIGPEKTKLPLTGKHIKYSFHQDNYALTFANPVPYGPTARFSWDTAQNGWFGQNPADARKETPCHMFFGFLRQR